MSGTNRHTHYTDVARNLTIKYFYDTSKWSNKNVYSSRVESKIYSNNFAAALKYFCPGRTHPPDSPKHTALRHVIVASYLRKYTVTFNIVIANDEPIKSPIYKVYEP